jgi:uncharacterized protein (DUF362 family)
LATVAIVKGERSLQTVQKALNLVGGLSELKDKPILIKVNFISTKTYETGATTDPIVVEALIQFLKPINERIFVVESNATTTDADEAFKATGMHTICEKYGVPFINLSKVRDRVSVKVQDPEALSKVTLPRIVFESYVISAAKLKTHSETKVSLGMKNMFGLLPDRFKFKFHLKGIEKVIVDVNTVIKPALTLIDGFIGMEGKGPVDGTPVKMDLIIAGKDPVATDAAAARVMGFNPLDVYHIRRAMQKSIGTMENIEVLGEKIEAVRREFRRG